MAGYKIFFDRDVEKDLVRIPKNRVAIILKKVAALADNPRSQQSEKLSGSDDAYRMRVGDYRVIYTILDTQKEIIIYHVRHRKDVYRTV